MGILSLAQMDIEKFVLKYVGLQVQYYALDSCPRAEGFQFQRQQSQRLMWGHGRGGGREVWGKIIDKGQFAKPGINTQTVQ